jgi:uncharacterized phage-associated protein
MAVTVKNFDPRKALEAIVYVASKTPQPGFHKISKIFYFADKLHLDRYGSLLSDDAYVAMENGPVPSRIYDFMKYVAGREDGVRQYNRLAFLREAFEVNGYIVRAKRAPNLDYFSQSELECLDEIIASHGRKTFGQLTDESHDDAWNSVPENAQIPVTEIIKTLPCSKELLEHYYK